MVLAEGVTDRRGRLLIPAGRALEERHLDALPMWGISQVVVEGGDPGEEAEALGPLDSCCVHQAQEEVEPLFRLANLEHPAMKVVWSARIKRRAQELQQEKAHG
jgi:hypothetical protein